MELGVTPAKGIRALEHGVPAVAAGVLESLQAPPTRSGALVHFLLTEDPSGLLQSPIFESTYRRCGHVLYESGAYILHGRVEQDARRGFSFVVQTIEGLGDSLAGRYTQSATVERASQSTIRDRGANRHAG